MNHKNKTKYLLLWCSPGFGLVDIWLPVIKELKKKDNVKIYFVFPEPSSIKLESKGSYLFNIAENFTDRVVYRGYSGRWFVESTLIGAHNAIKFSKFDAKIATLSGRLKKGKMSKYFVLKLIGKYLFIISKHFIRIKENFGKQSRFDFGLLNNVDGVLCDITAENKFVNNNLRGDLKDIPKFSMLHGLAVTWVSEHFNCNDPVKKRPDVTVYSMSNYEMSGYKKCFGILEENIMHAGIPRHDNNWIKFISKQGYCLGFDVFDSFVFIIGRPASPYNTPERKKKALENIYDIVCVKHKLKLVIKSHPKESLDGIDGRIYSDALGVNNYGENWIYSDSHPFVLGKKATFAISFYSGVSLDMLAINKPTIEYLDLRGLDAYDTEHSLRDESGAPVFSERYTKLVLGASTKHEFEQHVESILYQYKPTVLSLLSRYESYFKPFEGSSEMVADDIYKRIDNLKK